MAGGERAAHVGEDDLGRERPLGAAGPRDDAVGAVERAAVLDLDERPGPLDRGAVVGDAVDRRADDGLDARERRQGGVERRVRRVVGAVVEPSSASSSARNAALSSLPTSRAPASTAANASGSTWTEQPVTTTSASGLARRARRTAARDFSSAVEVTVQVFTRYEVGGRGPGRRAGPRPRAAAARRPPSRTG